MSLMYEELRVDGPEVGFIKPTAEAAPLYGIRADAAQPACGTLSAGLKFAEATPMGIGHRMCHHQCLADNEQRAALEPRRVGLPRDVWPAVAARVTAGETLRSLGHEYGVSRECIRGIALTQR